MLQVVFKVHRCQAVSRCRSICCRRTDLGVRSRVRYRIVSLAARQWLRICLPDCLCPSINDGGRADGLVAAATTWPVNEAPCQPRHPHQKGDLLDASMNLIVSSAGRWMAHAWMSTREKRGRLRQSGSQPNYTCPSGKAKTKRDRDSTLNRAGNANARRRNGSEINQCINQWVQAREKIPRSVQATEVARLAWRRRILATPRYPPHVFIFVCNCKCLLTGTGSQQLLGLVRELARKPGRHANRSRAGVPVDETKVSARPRPRSSSRPLQATHQYGDKDC